MTLDNHHRATVEMILAHPTSGNIEWRRVLSLMAAIGETVEEPNGKFKITVGPETEVFTPPRHKDVDEQMVVDLRRMLVQTGYGEEPAVEDDLRRDHGDGRWGKPS